MPRMRPGRIRHDIADRAIRTIIDTELTGMPTPAAPAQPPGCAYDPDGHANAAYRPLLPPVRLP